MSKKKRVIEIYYDPRENPKIEVYFLSEELALADKGLRKANERMRVIYSEIQQIVRYVGFDPTVVIKKKYITELGEPHFVPCIYVNDVLFATVYTFKPEKLLKILQDMKKIRDEYYEKLYKDIQYGYIMYPNEHYIHIRDPMWVNWIVSSKDAEIAQRLRLPYMSIDPYDEIPASGWLIYELRKQGVPVTPIGFSTEVKYKVLVTPERKHIEL